MRGESPWKSGAVWVLNIVFACVRRQLISILARGPGKRKHDAGLGFIWRISVDRKFAPAEFMRER
jgi:hypothetical protein